MPDKHEVGGSSPLEPTKPTDVGNEVWLTPHEVRPKGRMKYRLTAT